MTVIGIKEDYAPKLMINGKFYPFPIFNFTFLIGNLFTVLDRFSCVCTNVSDYNEHNLHLNGKLCNRDSNITIIMTLIEFYNRFKVHWRKKLSI